MTISHAVILVHVCAATVSLISGFLAIVLRKGGTWHAVAGTIFFVSMLTMSLSATIIATVIHSVQVNLVVALLTLYLVTTAWRAARNRDGSLGWFDRAALLLVLFINALAFSGGFRAAVATTPSKDGVPTVAYFIFGGIALLCAVTDVRLLLRGNLIGARRIARHLWRMSLSLLITTFSLYPGQARLFSRAIRDTNLMLVPHVLLVGAMLFWLYRASVRRVARVREV